MEDSGKDVKRTAQCFGQEAVRRRKGDARDREPLKMGKKRRGLGEVRSSFPRRTFLCTCSTVVTCHRPAGWIRPGGLAVCGLCAGVECD